MKRVNKFRLRPTKEQEKVLFSLCEMLAVLWNKAKLYQETSSLSAYIKRKLEEL